ncbi:MAG: M1 family metallopeptidase [Pseudomonadota bacterium]
MTEVEQTKDRLPIETLTKLNLLETKDFGFNIARVATRAGASLDYRVEDTLMKVDLQTPLAPGKRAELIIEWGLNLVDSRLDARGGYEYFANNDTYTYAVAHWLPRAASYTDYGGWNVKPFMGQNLTSWLAGEFTLEFGSYDVSITVPADHIVAATGELANPREVLTKDQQARLAEARKADKPVFIVTPEEAAENEKTKDSASKTWRFTAGNVRDFAWTSSRKYIWDGMRLRQTPQNGEPANVLVMSVYPNEALPLWPKYSTETVAHTLQVYSRFMFPYPYPVAISANAYDISGMEYPMLSFNRGRPADDSPIEERIFTKDERNNLVALIIHEAGHNYIPMVVNTDERQWAWMDEGVNTFLQYLTEAEWGDDFVAWSSGNDPSIVDFISEHMTSGESMPIMSELSTFKSPYRDVYTKPAAALVVLREVVLGREAFDDAFRTFAQRWRFKRPTPADFFRTMEDASGQDLGWFWRGWFFSDEYLDFGITRVSEYTASTFNPDIERNLKQQAYKKPLVQKRNEADGVKTLVERRPHIAEEDPRFGLFGVSEKDRADYQELLESLSDEERATFESEIERGRYIYFIELENVGGLLAPIPMLLTFDDQSTKTMTVSEFIWRKGKPKIRVIVPSDRKIASVTLDPEHGLPDANRYDNSYPTVISSGRISIEKADDD